MNRNYEGIVILDTKGADGGLEELIGAVTKDIEAEGAKVADVLDMGRRKFAYTSNHLDSGHYLNFSVTADPACIVKIKDRLRLNGHVHMQYFQRKN